MNLEDVSKEKLILIFKTYFTNSSIYDFLWECIKKKGFAFAEEKIFGCNNRKIGLYF